MSSNSYTSICPKCNSEMMSNSENRPYDSVSHECLECGFYAYTEEGRDTDLNYINELRTDQGLKPLDKLKEISQ